MKFYETLIGLLLVFILFFLIVLKCHIRQLEFYCQMQTAQIQLLQNQIEMTSHELLNKDDEQSNDEEHNSENNNDSNTQFEEENDDDTNWV